VASCIADRVLVVLSSLCLLANKKRIVERTKNLNMFVGLRIILMDEVCTEQP